MRCAVLLLLFLAIMPAALAKAPEEAELKVETHQVVGLTRFLEDHPLDESAPAIRALLIGWEETSKDSVDYVCPGVLAPIPAEDVPNSPELLGQFIFGSAAYQIANPNDKGKLFPGQLAGMRSMLKTYRAFVAVDANARIPRLDELSQMDADGTLATHLEPIVQKE